MSKIVDAIIVNRNLLSSLKETIEFLRQESRIGEILIIDHASTYPPLLEWYEKECKEKVMKLSYNSSAHNAWKPSFAYMRNQHFILADPDCSYEGVPTDWLDRMFEVLEDEKVFKVGFSLRIDDLPYYKRGVIAYSHELKFWEKRYKDIGWEAPIDTTFALYRPKSSFSYDAVRLDKPYCIKHLLWYLEDGDMSEEWLYYIKHCSPVSSWGHRLNKEMEESKQEHPDILY